MRTALFTIAAAASALTFAAPASAQWFPQPRGYGYGYYNHGVVNQLGQRINQLQRHIAVLDNRDIITEREARRLRNQSRDLERRLWVSARNGLSQREAYTLHNRMQRLEYQLHRDARDGRRYYRRW
jgi:predicted RNase H-like nuclease (RuvC/YqgF family)